LYSRHFVQKIHKQPVQSRLPIALGTRDEVDQACESSLIVHQLKCKFIAFCLRQKEGRGDLEDIGIIILMPSVSKGPYPYDDPPQAETLGLLTSSRQWMICFLMYSLLFSNNAELRSLWAQRATS